MKSNLALVVPVASPQELAGRLNSCNDGDTHGCDKEQLVSRKSCAEVRAALLAGETPGSGLWVEVRDLGFTKPRAQVAAETQAAVRFSLLTSRGESYRRATYSSAQRRRPEAPDCNLATALGTAASAALCGHH